MLYPPVSAGGVTGNGNISGPNGVRLPTSPKTRLYHFLQFADLLDTLLLYDPHSEHLLLQDLNLTLILFNAFRGV